MLEYYLDGAWGKEPDKKLVKALQKMGIGLEVTQRRDKLINFKLTIDDEQIFKNQAPSSCKKAAAKKPAEKKAAEKKVSASKAAKPAKSPAKKTTKGS